jgi:hypothetical protein
MKKIIIGGLLALSGAAMADGNKSFIMLDANSEKDNRSIASEYIGANLTVGIKTPNKTEYSVKFGVSAKDKVYDGTESISNNLEVKLKQSYDIGMFFLPYVSVRLGEKLNSDQTHFTHYAFDAGAKVPLVGGLSLDVGARYRDALKTSAASGDYKSTRVHAMFLYDVNEYNSLGLRYARSNADNYEEERKSWRVHYQRNY